MESLAARIGLVALFFLKEIELRGGRASSGSTVARVEKAVSTAAG